MLLSLEASVRPRRTLKVLSIPLFLLIWALRGLGHRLAGVVSKLDYPSKAILSHSSAEALIREMQEDAVVRRVSIGDLVKWIITGPAQTIQEVEGHITGAYPG